jgi:hypothetical protein
MNAVAASKYPVRVNGMERADSRFDGLAKVVGLELEQRGFPRLTGDTHVELEKALFEFVYGSRGFAGELEKRLNGTAAPLVAGDEKVDSYACCAAAHELRRLRGAEGALVVAVDDAGMVHIGCAVEPQSQADLLASKLISVLDDLAHAQISAVAMDVEVDERGGVS